MGGFAIYIEVFLKILHDAVYEKNLDVFIFSLLTNTCSKIWDDWHCYTFNSVDVVIAALIIHSNNKYSGWYFLL